MDKQGISILKKLYYENIRLSQIYSALSRKVKDQDIALQFRQFSFQNFSQSNEIEYILNSLDKKISIFYRILKELDSFWTGIFLYYLGNNFVLKTMSKNEKKLQNLLVSILQSGIDKSGFIEMINCADEHIKKIDSF